MEPLFPKIPDKLAEVSDADIAQLLTDHEAAAQLIDSDDQEFLIVLAQCLGTLLTDSRDSRDRLLSNCIQAKGALELAHAQLTRHQGLPPLSAIMRPVEETATV